LIHRTKKDRVAMGSSHTEKPSSKSYNCGKGKRGKQYNRGDLNKKHPFYQTAKKGGGTTNGTKMNPGTGEIEEHHRGEFNATRNGLKIEG